MAKTKRHLVDLWLNRAGVTIAILGEGLIVTGLMEGFGKILTLGVLLGVVGSIMFGGIQYRLGNRNWLSASWFGLNNE